jgi:hypothetical protein
MGYKRRICALHGSFVAKMASTPGEIATIGMNVLKSVTRNAATRMLCRSGDYEAEGWLGRQEFNRRMMSGSAAFFPCQTTTAAARSKEIEHMGGVIELQLARPSQEIDDCRAAE